MTKFKKFIAVILVLSLFSPYSVPLGQAAEPVQNVTGDLVPVVGVNEGPSKQEGITQAPPAEGHSPLSAPEPAVLSMAERTAVVDRMNDLDNEVYFSQKDLRDVILEVHSLELIRETYQARQSSFQEESQPTRVLTSAKAVLKAEAPIEDRQEYAPVLESFETLASEESRSDQSTWFGRLLTPIYADKVVIENAYKNLQLFNLVIFFIEKGTQGVSGLIQARYEKTREQIQEGEDFAQEIKKLKHLGPLLLPQPHSDQWSLPADTQNLSNEEYMTLDSVVIGQELAAAHLLLHPPKNLHPFLRFLFYWRFATPEVVAYYKAQREKMRKIYEKAKEGKGKIRYKNKIYDAFMPLPDDMGGLIELVQAVMGGNKKSILNPSH